MDIQAYIKTYEAELREIELLIEAYEKQQGAALLDTDSIEEILLDWEELMSDLREEGDGDLDNLADEIYEKLEEFQTILAEYDIQRAEYEEQEALHKAGNRLEQSQTENYLKTLSDSTNAGFDIARYHKADFRLNPQENSSDLLQPKKKSRLELEDES